MGGEKLGKFALFRRCHCVLLSCCSPELYALCPFFNKLIMAYFSILLAYASIFYFSILIWAAPSLPVELSLPSLVQNINASGFLPALPIPGQR